MYSTQVVNIRYLHESVLWSHVGNEHGESLFVASNVSENELPTSNNKRVHTPQKAVGLNKSKKRKVTKNIQESKKIDCSYL